MNAKEALERMLTYKISSKSKFRMRNVEDYDLVKSALTELAEIKKRAEEMRADIVRCSLHEGCYDDGMVSVNVPNIIDFILKGETK